MDNRPTTRHSQLCYCLCLVILIALPLLTTAFASEEESLAQTEVKAADIANANALATNFRYHLFKGKTPAANQYPADSQPLSFKGRITNPIATVPTPPGPFFYLGDVAPFGSPFKTIGSTKNHPVYIDMGMCGGNPTSCWGNPAKYLTDIGVSTMIHLTDQYTGLTTNGRYTLGTAVPLLVTIFPNFSGIPTLGESDIVGIAHAAAHAQGSGLGHLYHIFLPKGVDTCFDGGPCYSPLILGTFGFCAYHFTVTFADIGTVYFTVEPFQDVPGCQVPASGPTPPNGQLADSTFNVLSHELFEAISDPDTITGFRAFHALDFGAEIGDLCFAEPRLVTLNGHLYDTQLEYSDHYHACAAAP